VSAPASETLLERCGTGALGDSFEDDQSTRASYHASRTRAVRRGEEVTWKARKKSSHTSFTANFMLAAANPPQLARMTPTAQVRVFITFLPSLRVPLPHASFPLA
jgi:hypothetical protein